MRVERRASSSEKFDALRRDGIYFHLGGVTIGVTTRASQKKRFDDMYLRADSSVATSTNAKGHPQGWPFFSASLLPYERTGTRVISTRRFAARPCSVSLLAIGRVSPAPTVIMRSRITPRELR